MAIRPLVAMRAGLAPDLYESMDTMKISRCLMAVSADFLVERPDQPAENVSAGSNRNMQS